MLLKELGMPINSVDWHPCCSKAYCFLNNLSPQIAKLFATSCFFRSLLLLKKLEGALLGDIASLLQLLERLLARGVLLLGHDAALLGLHQVLLGQTTGSVLGRAVPDLRLGANSRHLTASLDILTRNIGGLGVRGRGRIRVHFYSIGGEIKT